MISFEKNTVFSTGIAMSVSFMDDKGKKEKAKHGKS